MKSISYNMHHSPWGSYSSFVMGEFNTGGGFVQHNVQPPVTNIYLAYAREGETVRMFPFYSDNQSGLSQENYVALSETSGFFEWQQDHVSPFSVEEIDREITWGRDTWKAGDMTFSLITPFGKIPPLWEIPKDEAKFHLAPLVFAQLTLDNQHSDLPLNGLFALQGMKRLLSDSTGNSIQGVALGASYGFATQSGDPSVTEVMDWCVAKTAFEGGGHPRRLGSEAGLSFLVPPGKKKSYTLVLGFYKDGTITAGRKTQMYYTYYFDSLEEVLKYGLDNKDHYLAQAEKWEEELSGFPVTKDKKELMTIAAAGYLANTELLADEMGEPYFFVNEGEYQMMNTLDLVVDQAFWELHYTPWTVKNELNTFLEFYSYQDSVYGPGGEAIEAGMTFCHDQGVADNFTPSRYSSYEIPGLTGCFSYMSSEELLNWIITAALYIKYTWDEEWLKDHSQLISNMLDSIKARDLDDNGIIDTDSLRCNGGSEITTYDSLDPSLGQAKDNLYLGVKTWSAYICLYYLLHELNDPAAERALEEAGKAAQAIIAHRIQEEKYIPAVFEKGNTSRIIPAVEGLLYPYLLGLEDLVSEKGPFGSFISCLKEHLNTVLQPGVCIDSRSGGWKLSSTNDNTWMSKIFVNQYVARYILEVQSDLWDEWDKIHLGWQKESSGHFAATDQVNSATGKALGSRLYPRLVTLILFTHYLKKKKS